MNYSASSAVPRTVPRWFKDDPSKFVRVIVSQDECEVRFESDSSSCIFTRRPNENIWHVSYKAPCATGHAFESPSFEVGYEFLRLAFMVTDDATRDFSHQVRTGFCIKQGRLLSIFYTERSTPFCVFVTNEILNSLRMFF